MKKTCTLALLLALAISCPAQNAVDINLALGFTGVDIDKLVTKDESSGTTATDWGLFSYGLGGQFTISGAGKLSYGAELMYHYMFWYSVRIPYGVSPIYREYLVSAVRLTPLLRFRIGSGFEYDTGLEFNFFSDGLTLGLLMAPGYTIPVNESIDIPLKLRVDLLFDVVFITPVSLQAGVRIKL